MKEYKVIWEIDVEASTPEEAAKVSQAIQRDPDSTATFFDVTDRNTGKTVVINLEEEEPAK